MPSSGELVEVQGMGVKKSVIGSTGPPLYNKIASLEA